MSRLCKIASLDHLVLTVKSVPRTVSFYTSLGMKHEQFTPAGSSVARHALLYGQSKINLHELGKEFEPKAQNVQVGSGDLCFLVEDKVDDVLLALKNEGIEVLEGGKVVERTGARGKLRSAYIRDPDGNLVE
jgi:catechol 2,3-dioxygenase-like lactoylglutathione lyase family enzyme